MKSEFVINELGELVVNDDGFIFLVTGANDKGEFTYVHKIVLHMKEEDNLSFW